MLFRFDFGHLEYLSYAGLGIQEILILERHRKTKNPRTSERFTMRIGRTERNDVYLSPLELLVRLPINPAGNLWPSGPAP